MPWRTCAPSSWTPKGNLYISQGWVPWVQVFDTKRNPIKQFGAAGQGPGEMVFAPVTIDWRGDTLWVVEPGVPAGTAHLFGPDGRETTQLKWRMPDYTESSMYSAGRPLSDGSVLPNRSIVGPLEKPKNFVSFFDAERHPIVRFSRDGAVLDTIATVGYIAPRTVVGEGRTMSHPFADFGGEISLPIVVTADGSAVVFVEQKEKPVERSAYSPLRLLDRVAPPAASLDLLVIGIHGDTIADKKITYEPKRPTSEMEDRIREGFGEWHSRLPSTRDGKPMCSPAACQRQREEAMKALTFPEYLPPVRRIVAGEDGTIWLLRELRPDRADLWEIYDRIGALQGSVLISTGRTFSDFVAWAERQTVLRASLDEIWTTDKGELDVPMIHRFKIQRACK